MTNLVEALFKYRKYPFIFTLMVLFFCIMTLIFTNINNTTTFTTFDPIGFYPDIKVQPLDDHPPPSPALADSSTSPKEKDQEELPRNIVAKITTTTRPKDKGLLKWEEVFGNVSVVDVNMDWKLCKGVLAVDYIPCLDNFKAIKALKSRRHMENRERHCPNPSPHCLVPLPKGYKIPVLWPKSRDMIWYDNVPHPKLVEYKKEQNWVVKSGEYLVFPGGGTQFKEGVNHYIKFIEETLPSIQWGKNIRVVLDVGCGVASFGGYLLDKNVVTMSFAPKDEHEAQIQFALERGIPATLSVIGTQKLTFPDNGLDLIHCARCRVHWDANGGKPLLELNRILRPGGFFVWSATPVYRDDERDQKPW